MPVETQHVDKPFNAPDGRVGRAVFRFLGWLERRIAGASLVGATAFFDESLFPWVQPLKANWRGVEAEAARVLLERANLPSFQDISREVGYITDDDRWKTFMLLGYGLRSEQNLRRCPATAAMLERIPGVKTAFFSILEPGKRIPPHRGPYNGVLRLHLGLVIPAEPERCWLRVADERRHWLAGEVLIFDDSLEHEVHNDTDEVRVVLFVDFLRPCRGPVAWLNRLVVYLARFSPMVRAARRNQERWERTHYARDTSAGTGGAAP